MSAGSRQRPDSTDLTACAAQLVRAKSKPAAQFDFLILTLGTLELRLHHMNQTRCDIRKNSTNIGPVQDGPMKQAAWLLTALAAGGHAEQLVEFHGRDGERELLSVTPERPERLCLRTFEQPPLYAWPVMQVYLGIQLKMTEDSGTGSGNGLLGWLFPGQTSRLQLDVKTQPPGMLCRMAGSWLRKLMPGVCKDCSSKCPARLHRRGDQLAVFLPPAGGCVYIRKVPADVEQVSVAWHWHLDLSVFAFLMIGLTLVLAWRPLSESSVFHAGLGGIGSLLLIGIMAAFWIFRSARGTVHGTIPFGRSLTTLAAAAFAFIPAARNVILSWAWRWLPAPEWRTWLSMRDPFFELPVGWLIFGLVMLICLVLVQLGANMAVRYFASAPEPEGEVQFIIGGDGRRVDLLPPVPVSQRMLGWAIWLSGLGFLLSGTHSDACSVVIVAVVLFKDHALHLVRTAKMWREAEVQPKDLHDLVSSSQMHAQANAATRDALEQLQKYLKEHPTAVQKVREDTELRLRRFSVDGAHVRPPLVPVTLPSRSSCSLQ
ncbi:unnamed protein product [Symbiodinium natans]|uniref:Uncharacterized protein n=1 Tax=Symbiodinium natans TaxID=878477 RepID=A0A812L664_9DINO|nr:unnamed protein product [Symbiodinium natans]